MIELPRDKLIDSLLPSGLEAQSAEQASYLAESTGAKSEYVWKTVGHVMMWLHVFNRFEIRGREPWSGDCGDW